jgi:hypothetical protein
MAFARAVRLAALLGVAICAVPAAAAPGDFGIVVSGSQSVYSGGRDVSGAATDFSSMAPLTVTQAKRLGWPAFGATPFAFGASDPAAGLGNRAAEPYQDETRGPHDPISVHGSLGAYAGGGSGGSESGYDFSLSVHN